MNPSLFSPVETLRGVGEKRAQALHRAGIRQVKDLLLTFPRSYKSGRIYPLSKERIGLYGGFLLKADSSPGVFSMRGKRVLRYTATDENGTKVNILYVNQPYLRNQIFKGDEAHYFGILQEKAGQLFLFSPERKREAPDPDRLYPVYPALGGISSGTLERLIGLCLVPTLSEWEETLPESVREKFGLMNRAKAIFTLHVPESDEALKRAKERFA
ncbi:MAG: hypothetical protein IKC69_02170, partial [Clostridia bacterium]|nr:hypothetical protein [Clostridia bacterium]